MKDPRPPWRKSTYSNAQANCVEVAAATQIVAVRDTKNPDAPALTFNRQDWQEFTWRVKQGAAGQA